MLPSTVTLRALTGEPLNDPIVRDMVVATANAIAERHGVTLIDVSAARDSVRILVDGPQLVAIGLAAELRRLTNRWFEEKYEGPSLWGEVHHSSHDEEPDDQADWWKTA